MTKKQDPMKSLSQPLGEGGGGESGLPAIKIATYFSLDAPDGDEALAFIYLNGERLPVSFRGETMDAAKAAAELHWEGVLAKEGAAMKRRTELAEQARARKALKGSATLSTPVPYMEEGSNSSLRPEEGRPPGKEPDTAVRR